jgi:hypothetical protein
MGLLLSSAKKHSFSPFLSIENSSIAESGGTCNSKCLYNLCTSILFPPFLHLFLSSFYHPPLEDAASDWKMLPRIGRCCLGLEDAASKISENLAQVKGFLS